MVQCNMAARVGGHKEVHGRALLHERQWALKPILRGRRSVLSSGRLFIDSSFSTWLNIVHDVGRDVKIRVRG